MNQDRDVAGEHIVRVDVGDGKVVRRRDAVIGLIEGVDRGRSDGCAQLVTGVEVFGASPALIRLAPEQVVPTSTQAGQRERPEPRYRSSGLFR